MIASNLGRGLLATALVVAASLGVSISVSPGFLGSWGTMVLVAMVPAQIVISLVWQSAYPARLASLSQPWRGLAFCLLNVLCGVVVAWLAWQGVGGGISPPTPFVNMYLILAVPVVLLLVIPLQAWPFALWCKDPAGLGAALLGATYGLNYLLFRGLFDFSFLSGAPFYVEALDPHGLLMAWQPLVLSIAAVVPTLALVLADFWPLSRLAGRQPGFGLAALLLIGLVAAALWLAFVTYGGMDQVLFMVRICIAVNFGYFILLVAFGGMPELKLAQPWRGIVLSAVAILLAAGLLYLYERVAVARFALPSGAPAYDLELWLASSMLAVTFPALVIFANYFQFWPLASREPAAAEAGERGAEVA